MKVGGVELVSGFEVGEMFWSSPVYGCIDFPNGAREDRIAEQFLAGKQLTTGSKFA
jgi:hypothetical protein